MSTPERAAIYARISTKDEASGYNVEKTADQIKNLRRLAAQRGYDVHDVYEDDGISAKEAGLRPQFDRLLTDLGAGKFTVILATEESRLARNIAEKNGLLMACAAVGGRWETIRDGVTDPATASGELMALIRGAIDSFESRRKAERQRASNADTRDKGKPFRSGARPFGFEPNRMTERTAEAGLIRSGTAAILGGASLNSVVREWRASGITPVKGGVWSRAAVKSVLTRNSNAALVEHADQVIGEGVPEWDRIVSRADLQQVQTLLSPGGVKLYATTLLTGIARCRCGQTMVGNGAGAATVMYVCSARTRGRAKPGDAHTGIAQHLLDDAVRRHIVDLYFLTPRQSGAADAEAATLAEQHEALRKIKTKLDKLEDLYLEDGISHASYTRKRAVLVTSQDETQRRIAQLASASAHATLLLRARRDLFAARSIDLSRAVDVKRQLGEAFDALTLDARRSLVAATLSITVHPGRGTERVAIAGGTDEDDPAEV